MPAPDNEGPETDKMQTKAVNADGNRKHRRKPQTQAEIVNAGGNHKHWRKP